MEFIFGLLVVIIFAAAAFRLFIASQGDAEIVLLVDQRTDFEVVERTEQQVVFSCKLPFVNRGRQDGTIMDAYPRHLAPMEYFNAAKMESRLTLETNPRPDGYWESFIVVKGTGDAMVVTLTFSVSEGRIEDAMKSMVDLPVDIVYQVVGRSDWYITKNRITITAQEVFIALGMENSAA